MTGRLMVMVNYCSRTMATMQPLFPVLLIVLRTAHCSQAIRQWSDVNLPLKHVPFYFYNNPDVRTQCLSDTSCPYQNLTDEVRCWGYEIGCNQSLRMSTPQCEGEVPRAWASSRESQLARFWRETDFGYVESFRQQYTVLCDSHGQSYFACAPYMRYCEARNIFMNFTELHSETSQDSFRKDVFQTGQLGGICKLSSTKWKTEDQHQAPLQSWFSELHEYESVDEDTANKCDVIIDKPTIFIKLDYGGSLYHHFCDFFNLYVAQHVNGSFDTDINIVMWDTSFKPYSDLFADTWKVFSDHPVIHLNTYNGKTVCVRHAIFSLLARMQHGLYYSTPVMPGCHGSSLFRAFSQHVLHRLGVIQEGPLDDKIRVTFLLRNTTYRRVLNQDELIQALQSVPDYHVQAVDFNSKYPFIKQLEVIHNTDIFIGMHGAGLAHLLFLPDWAAIFELLCIRRRDRIRSSRIIHLMLSNSCDWFSWLPITCEVT